MMNWFDMLGTYDLRKVARNEYSWGMISTCSVTDGRHPFETAVSHEDYENMVIVEAYDTYEAATEGHKRWVEIMKNPPDKLVDCQNSWLGHLCGGLEYKRND